MLEEHEKFVYVSYTLIKEKTVLFDMHANWKGLYHNFKGTATLTLNVQCS